MQYNIIISCDLNVKYKTISYNGCCLDGLHYRTLEDFAFSVCNCCRSVELGRGQGSPCIKRWFIRGLTYRDKQPIALTFSPTGNLESAINLQVFGMREKVGAPRGNLRQHTKNMQTPHREDIFQPRTFLL